MSNIVKVESTASETTSGGRKRRETNPREKTRLKEEKRVEKIIDLVMDANEKANLVTTVAACTQLRLILVLKRDLVINKVGNK